MALPYCRITFTCEPGTNVIQTIHSLYSNITESVMRVESVFAFSTSPSVRMLCINSSVNPLSPDSLLKTESLLPQETLSPHNWGFTVANDKCDELSTIPWESLASDLGHFIESVENTSSRAVEMCIWGHVLIRMPNGNDDSIPIPVLRQKRKSVDPADIIYTPCLYFYLRIAKVRGVIRIDISVNIETDAFGSSQPKQAVQSYENRPSGVDTRWKQCATVNSEALLDSLQPVIVMPASTVDIDGMYYEELVDILIVELKRRGLLDS